MIQIEVTPNEHQILADIVAQQIVDLRVEIVGTDRSTYKKMLKNEKECLVHLLEKIQTLRPVVEPA